MRKAVAAVTVGILLVAGQAAAGSNSAAARVGDRVGGKSGQSEEFLGAPLGVLLIGGAVLVATIAVASDDGASD